MAEPTKTPAASESTTAKAGSPRLASLKKWAIVVGAGMLAALIAFAVGYFMGAASTQELEARAEAAAREARLLEGRRRLDLAHIALEQQNFGIAEAHVRAAAQKLDAAAEAESEDLQQLARAVAETRIGVTEDIASQQQQVRQLIARFDRLHPPASPDSASPAVPE